MAQMFAKSMRPESPVLVRIFKQESELEVWKIDKTGNYALLKTYPMCRWSGKLGPKTKTGDRQAPEGFYHVSAGMLNPIRNITSPSISAIPTGWNRRLVTPAKR